jgi:hypothetical protein
VSVLRTGTQEIRWKLRGHLFSGDQRRCRLKAATGVLDDISRTDVFIGGNR